MNEQQLLHIRLQMEALITEREYYIAINTQRAKCDEVLLTNELFNVEKCFTVLIHMMDKVRVGGWGHTHEGDIS